MIVSIMQPAYLPWLGYFDRLSKSDLHIVLDDVNIDSNSKTKFANRNKIRTPTGWIWLTVPLQSKGLHGELFLNQAIIAAGSPWREKHFGAIKANYARCSHFAEHRSYFQGIYSCHWTHLFDLAMETTGYLQQAFGIACEIRRSSELAAEGQKDRLILNLCRAVGASAYISGPFGREYLDAAMFSSAGIELLFHDYTHPEYRQAFSGFEAYMSAVDVLFNHGPAARDILLSSPSSLVSSFPLSPEMP